MIDLASSRKVPAFYVLEVFAPKNYRWTSRTKSFQKKLLWHDGLRTGQTSPVVSTNKTNKIIILAKVAQIMFRNLTYNCGPDCSRLLCLSSISSFKKSSQILRTVSKKQTLQIRQSLRQELWCNLIMLSSSSSSCSEGYSCFALQITFSFGWIHLPFCVLESPLTHSLTESVPVGHQFWRQSVSWLSCCCCFTETQHSLVSKQSAWHQYLRELPTHIGTITVLCHYRKAMQYWIHLK